MNMYGEGKVTKADVENYIACLCNISPSYLLFAKLEDSPQVWKHSCAQTGVTILAPTQTYLNNVKIQYAVCPLCGRVLYYTEEQYLY